MALPMLKEALQELYWLTEPKALVAEPWDVNVESQVGVGSCWGSPLSRWYMRFFSP